MVVSIQIIKPCPGTKSNPKALTFLRPQHFRLSPKKVATACKCRFKHGQFHYTTEGLQRFPIGHSSTAKQNRLAPSKKSTRYVVSGLVIKLENTLLQKHNVQGFRLLGKIPLLLVEVGIIPNAWLMESMS